MEVTETPEPRPTPREGAIQEDAISGSAADNTPTSSQGETKGTVTPTGDSPGQETQKKSKRSGYRWSK